MFHFRYLQGGSRLAIFLLIDITVEAGMNFPLNGFAALK